MITKMPLDNLSEGLHLFRDLSEDDKRYVRENFPIEDIEGLALLVESDETGKHYTPLMFKHTPIRQNRKIVDKILNKENKKVLVPLRELSNTLQNEIKERCHLDDDETLVLASIDDDRHITQAVILTNLEISNSIPTKPINPIK